MIQREVSRRSRRRRPPARRARRGRTPRRRATRRTVGAGSGSRTGRADRRLPFDRERLAEALQLLPAGGRGVEPVRDELVGRDRSGIEETSPYRAMTRSVTLGVELTPASILSTIRSPTVRVPSILGSTRPPRPRVGNGAHGRLGDHRVVVAPTEAEDPDLRPVLESAGGRPPRGCRRSRGRRRRASPARARAWHGRGSDRRAGPASRPARAPGGRSRAQRIRRWRTVSTAITAATNRSTPRTTNSIAFLPPRPVGGIPAATGRRAQG